MKSSQIAYFGIPGSYTYLAARQYFEGNLQDSSTFLSTQNFKEIFSMLTTTNAKYAVVPIENSLAGSVYDVYDLLWEYKSFAIGEIYVRIEHNLLVLPDHSISKEDRLKKIRKVISHSKAIEQCQNFLGYNKSIEQAVFSDTARAAQHVRDSKDMTLAAIASKESARIYGLQILANNIEDNKFNFTRFLILSSELDSPVAKNKCSLIFSLPHTPQSLTKALNVISDDKINITKIESRPIHGKPFEYVFYVDFEFQESNLEYVESCLSKLEEKTLNLKLLGLYQKAKVSS